MGGAAVLLVTFLGGASALTGSCQNWCSKYTCDTTAHCGGCTEANKICEANRPCTKAFDSQCSGVTGATLMGAHRMCNEVSDCAPLCTCTAVLEAAAAAAALAPAPTSSSSDPVAAPTGTCDVSAMSTLKSKLQTMIADQRTTNSALQQTVYPGANPFPPPAAPSPPPLPSNCAKEYSQCGGKTHKGPTCCQKGSSCRYQNDFYSQCRK
jgi:hypothetical protein